MNEKMKKKLQAQMMDQKGPIDDEQLKQWILDTNLDDYGFDTSKFGHINKNMATSNLNSSQTQELIRLSENVQLLRHFNMYTYVVADEDEVVEEFTAYDSERAEAQAKAWAQANPKRAKHCSIERTVENRHPPIVNLLVDNMTATEKATGGKAMALLRMLKTLFTQEEKTVEDKSASHRSGIIQSMLPNNSGSGRRR